MQITVKFTGTPKEARIFASAPELLEALVRLLECPNLTRGLMEPETRQACTEANCLVARLTP